MGKIYQIYCQRQNFKCESDQCILKGELRPDIRSCSPEARKYYEWVQQIHGVFSHWNHKLQTLAANHDDMLNLARNYPSIHKVAKAVYAIYIIVSDEHIGKMRTTYLQDFEKLNLLLLRYVPEVPRAKWYV